MFYSYIQSFASLTFQQGWNWVGLYVYDNQDGRTLFVMYQSTNLNADGTSYSESVYLNGVYTDNFANTEIVFGCLLQASNPDYVYGFCMKGFIYSFEVFDTLTVGFSLDQEHSCAAAGVAGCNLCANGVGNQCFANLNLVIIEKWELTNNIGYSTKQIIATNKYNMSANSDY